MIIHQVILYWSERIFTAPKKTNLHKESLGFLSHLVSSCTVTWCDILHLSWGRLSVIDAETEAQRSLLTFSVYTCIESKKQRPLLFVPRQMTVSKDHPHSLTYVSSMCSQFLIVLENIYWKTPRPIKLGKYFIFQLPNAELVDHKSVI